MKIKYYSDENMQRYAIVTDNNYKIVFEYKIIGSFDLTKNMWMWNNTMFIDGKIKYDYKKTKNIDIKYLDDYFKIKKEELINNVLNKIDGKIVADNNNNEYEIYLLLNGIISMSKLIK
jgi:hypothetical protein